MEEALRQYLLDGQSVTQASGGRIHYVVRPQGGALPALVLTRISGLRLQNHGAPANLVDSRVQVDCYAATYGAAKGLARAVIARVNGAKATVGGVKIHGIFPLAERDLSDASESDGVRVFRISIDLRVWHQE